MGLRPTQDDEKRLLSSHRSPWTYRPSPLSSRAKPKDLQFYGPFLGMFFDRERTGISCHAAPEGTGNAPLRKERRMKFAEATKFHRKYRGA
jgi:hypothetical protein